MSENEDHLPGTAVSHNRDDEARQDVVEWIQHILDRKRMNPTDLARVSQISPSTLLRIMNDKNHRFVPSFRTVKKISEGSGYPLSDKLARIFSGDEVRERNVASQAASTKDSEDRAHLPPMRATVPIRFVSSLPRGLQPKNDGDQGRAVCPLQMEGDSTAFAFYVPDSKLSPWVQAGALVFASQRNDPSEDDIVLIETEDGKSIVRLVKDITSDGIKVADAVAGRNDQTVDFNSLSFIAVVKVINRL